MPDGGAGLSLVWLERPLPRNPRPAADSRFTQLLRLSSKGEDGSAALLAEAILSEGIGDIQVLARYAFGAFLSQGFVILPRVLDAMTRAVEPALSAKDTKRRSEAEVALTWLLRTARDRIDFHQTIKDPTWSSWIEATTPPLCDAISESARRLLSVLQEGAKGSPSIEHVTGVEAFVRNTLRGLLPKPAPPPAKEPPPPPRAATPAQEPEKAPEKEAAKKLAQEPARESADDSPKDEAPPEPRQAPARATSRSSRAAETPRPPDPPPRQTQNAPSPRAPATDLDSPALDLLRRKIAAFSALVERGDLGRASIVARDLEHTIAHFDPRIYLPRLFAPFWKRLAFVGEELVPYWENEGSVSFRAMTQLYQSDLDAFLEEDEPHEDDEDDGD